MGTNMQKSLVDVLKGADSALLMEILREAESRLQAQLSSALAADLRAITFLGFLAAVTVATFGAGMAALDKSFPLSVIAIFTGSGFGLACFYAFEAARPVDFQFVGNDPSSWRRDIEASIGLQDALAEQVAYYDEMLKDNRKAMAESAVQLERAASVARITMGIGAFFAVMHLFGLLPS